MRSIGRSLASLLLLPVVASASFGPIQITRHEEQKFENTACAVNQSCSLKAARLITEDYEFWADDRTHHGTRTFALYQTSDAASVGAYAWVQFIRGCQFSSSKLPDGTIGKTLDIARDYFGGVVLFKHPDWVIDSDDTDPMYNSPDDPALDRHAYYRWNKVEGSFDQASEVYFRDQAPARPELYVSDRPGQVWIDPVSRVAKNISLELRMCLYRTADIPLVGTPSAVDFASPLVCFPWRSSFVYDFERGEFARPAALDPVCVSR